MTKIAIVGEAHGQEEERQGKPFVGASGRVLDGMLKLAGINRDECYITNTFNFRPPNNDITALCGPKAEMPLGYNLGALQQGCYVRPQFLPELDRLKAELEAVKPNVVIALGNTPCWALLRRTGIKMLRGVATTGPLVPGLKVVPAWHPAAVMRDWTLRPSAILDLQKAERHSHYPELRRTARTLFLQPTLADLDAFWESDLRDADCISIDIENPHEYISCIGFAPSPHRCLVVPFEDLTTVDGNYWRTPAEEKAARLWVKKVLLSPNAKVGHNFGSYDILHIWKGFGMRVNAFTDDTMMLAHSLQPEEKKSLGFLGALMCDETSWKDMREHGKRSIKRDE